MAHSFSAASLTEQLTLSPEERCRALLASGKTKILERIPQHLMANYLGVTPVSLSRIRARVAWGALEVGAGFLSFCYRRRASGSRKFGYSFHPPLRPATPMKSLLKTEELAEMLLAVFVFAHLPYAWWVLPAAFLLPDLSMLGYLASPRVGAASYNLLHHKAVAIAVGVAGWLLGQPVLVLAGTVLLFHSAFDRLLGYGLKYATGFHDTHLGRVGKAPVAATASPVVA